jgi:hypothetical protein
MPTEHEETVRAIAKIIKDHAAVEQSQRDRKMGVNSIVDGQSYAYAQIVDVMQPYLDEA